MTKLYPKLYHNERSSVGVIACEMCFGNLSWSLVLVREFLKSFSLWFQILLFDRIVFIIIINYYDDANDDDDDDYHFGPDKSCPLH